jgi:hypothetical protein
MYFACQSCLLLLCVHFPLTSRIVVCLLAQCQEKDLDTQEIFIK